MKKSQLVDQFNDLGFIVSLGYLSDIFGHLNDLSISMLGPDVTLLDARERISSFRLKLQLWIKRVKKYSYCNFPTLEELINSDKGADPTLFM